MEVNQKWGEPVEQRAIFALSGDTLHAEVIEWSPVRDREAINCHTDVHEALRDTNGMPYAGMSIECAGV